MSVPQTIAVDPAALPLRDRLAGRVAVVVAKRLAKRSPRRIQQALRRLRRGAAPATYAQAAAARAVVTGISLDCTGPQGCLPRSIATALLCRLRGTWPTWCVGVRVLPPFGAHAWVVADDRDVEEPYPAGYHKALISVEPAR
ncbi:MAG TPA: lasso peptide biosynthesis B2 protein [Kribbellaceae bacterium]|jgi:hypothetical protein